MRALQPLRELGRPLADISQAMPFTVVQSAFDGFFPRGQIRSYWKSLYLADLSDEAIDVMVGMARERPAGRSPFELVYFDVFPMGGAVGRVDPAATAFGERSAKYLVAVDGNWTDAADDADSVAWVRRTWSEVNASFGTGATYLNFSDATRETDPRGTAASANRRRLARIKAAYDPENVFHRNNNILPAAGADSSPS